MPAIHPDVDAEVILDWAKRKLEEAKTLPYFPTNSSMRVGYTEALEEIIALIETGRSSDEII